MSVPYLEQVNTLPVVSVVPVEDGTVREPPVVVAGSVEVSVEDGTVREPPIVARQISVDSVDSVKDVEDSVEDCTDSVEADSVEEFTDSVDAVSVADPIEEDSVTKDSVDDSVEDVKETVALSVEPAVELDDVELADVILTDNPDPEDAPPDTVVDALDSLDGDALDDELGAAPDEEPPERVARLVGPVNDALGDSPVLAGGK